jgi:dTDP-D-glucose 4,6-dehydratase
MALTDIVSSSFFPGKKILITGGAGFLGSWLSDTLVACGAQLVCADNSATGRESNISQLMGDRNFSFQRLDVAEEAIDERFDLIFHFASRASPDEYQQHPGETMLANSYGTRNVRLYVRRKCESSFEGSAEAWKSLPYISFVDVKHLQVFTALNAWFVYDTWWYTRTCRMDRF